MLFRSGLLVITLATRELLLDVLHEALLLAGAVPLVLHLALNLSLGKSNSSAVYLPWLCEAGGCVKKVRQEALFIGRSRVDKAPRVLS